MNKLKHLSIENISKKSKIILSLSVGFAFSFNLMFFSMLFIFIGNSQYFTVELGSVTLTAAAICLPLWIVISGILFVLPGKFSTIAASFAVGLIIAGYIQSSILNGSVYLGDLTGAAIGWHEYTMHTLLGVAIWLVLLILPLLTRYFITVGIWQKSLLIACALITGMQVAALVMSYIEHSGKLQHAPEYYLSREGTFDVSAAGNIMVFIVDRVDYDYIETIREGDPRFFDMLDGFTEFTNAAASCPATFPAAARIMTGVPYDYEMGEEQYIEHAWSSSQFIPMLKDAGFTMKYHMTKGHHFTNYEQIMGIADNLKAGRPTPKLGSIAGSFAQLAAYRVAPLALKPFFWMPTVVIETTADISDREYITNDDPLFMELLAENGLTLYGEGKNYFYIHLIGAHDPYTMDENAVYVGTSDVISQTKGSFNILFRYMDEMKRLGVYEDSTIIIAADHGYQSLHIAFYVKPSGSAGTPLEFSDAPISIGDNLLPTILESEGMEHSQFGLSAFEVEQDADAVRYAVGYGDSGASYTFYKIDGHVSDRSNWEYLGSINR